MQQKKSQNEKEQPKEPPHAPGAGSDKQHPVDDVDEYPIDKEYK